MNSGAADETRPAGDATEDDTRQTGAPEALGHTPRHTPPRAAVSGCLVVCRLDAVTPLAPRSDGCVYNPGRSSDLLRLVPLPAPLRRQWIFARSYTGAHCCGTVGDSHPVPY